MTYAPAPTDAPPLDDPDEGDLLAGLKSGAWLDAQTFPALSWAVHGLIPEGFGLFTGPPKAGKSWAALGIALAVAAGTPALGKIDTGRPRPVLLLALEDGSRRLQGRCRHLLGDGVEIPERLEFATDTAPATVVPLIRAWLAKHGRQRPLVVLDTLGKVMPAALPGEGAYQRDYRIGSTLKRLVDTHPGSTLLVVHHVNKRTDGADWMDSTSSTNGLNGAADFTVNLSRQRNESTGILRVTGRDVVEGEYAVTSDSGRWSIDGDALADAARKAAEAKVSDGLGDRSAEIIAYVNAQAEPVSAKQVEGALGITDARRYLARLAEARRLSKPERGRYAPCVPLSQVSQCPNGDTETPAEWDNGTDGTPTCTGCGEPMSYVEPGAMIRTCGWLSAR